MMSRLRMRGAATAVAALLALALSACAPGGEAPDGEATTPSTGLPDGVTVELQQGRSDVAARQAQVVVRNGTDETLVVGSVEVEDPRFAAPIVRVEERESTIGPGRTVGIRVQLPDAACAGDATEAVGSTVILDYTLGDDSGRASAGIEDPIGFIEPLHVRDCRADAVADAAHVSFTDFDPSPPGEPAALMLGIAPTGRSAVLISGIQTTNLITFEDGGDTALETLPIGLEVREGDTGMTEVSLPIVPIRCDPHAVQEDKRGTIFDLEVEVDGEPGEIELAASEELRGQVLTWVADWCGFGG
ncbi:hypothetical protein MK786_06115 [Microbacterium sp. CFH 31415]|uniref:hypothetical protein n=1 Tax=Microbacterium sp. CFH 31415 TaxID=2921732 RepID=UPI001F1419D5|nr:hypothetical protein [Microbacterium sp. CFH 31415]MCH6230308.1 hypothetical protein [Microbacterium sp. CFH 31415]